MIDAINPGISTKFERVLYLHCAGLFDHTNHIKSKDNQQENYPTSIILVTTLVNH